MSKFIERNTIISDQEANKITQAPPALYAVKFINNNETSFDFVAIVVAQEFNIFLGQAYEFANEVHENGYALIGALTLDVAQTKADIINNEAQLEGYPLLCDIEPLI